MWTLWLLKNRMTLFGVVFSLIWLTTMPTLAQQQKQNRQAVNTNKSVLNESTDETSSHLAWSLGLAVEQQRDSLSQQRTETNLSARLKWDYTLNSFTFLKIYPRAYFQNGYVQSVSASKPKGSSFDLAEASLNLHDEDTLRFSLGALNQQRDNSGLLFADISFPAVQMRTQFGEAEESFIAFFAQGAIPSSSSVSSNSRDYEKTPSLITAGLSTQWKSSIAVTRMRGSYFKFSDLPSNVAKDSGLLGNTTIGDVANPSSQFKYQYQGYEAGLGFNFNLTSATDVQLEGNFIQNQSAPSSLNQGYTAGTQLNVQSGVHRWSPIFEYFRIEPDAAVAYFNSSDYQTNRIGYGTGLKYRYKKNLAVKVTTGERSVIYESASQYRERFYSLSLETANEAF